MSDEDQRLQKWEDKRRKEREAAYDPLTFGLE